jgi:hypothetical protein
MFMKPRHALIATLIGIAVAAAAQSGHAGAQDEMAAPQQLALQKPRSDATQRPASPLSLQLEDAGGNPVRLLHVPGVGWQYDRTAADSPLRKTAMQAGAPATPASADDLPLTVFIDGPSGFTYVWNRNDGWKCIGRLVDDGL